jgi:hypothetical protein
MQAKEARELRRQWGKAPCDHPEFDKEYDLGANTGDYVCTRCGKAFTEEEKDKIVDKQYLNNKE